MLGQSAVLMGGETEVERARMEKMEKTNRTFICVAMRVLGCCWLLKNPKIKPRAFGLINPANLFYRVRLPQNTQTTHRPTHTQLHLNT